MHIRIGVVGVADVGVQYLGCQPVVGRSPRTLFCLLHFSYEFAPDPSVNPDAACPQEHSYPPLSLVGVTRGDWGRGYSGCAEEGSIPGSVVVSGYLLPKDMDNSMHGKLCNMLQPSLLKRKM